MEEETPTEQPKEEERVNIVEEAKRIRDEIAALKTDLKQENDRKEKIQAEEMLAGTTGKPAPVEEKPETNEEYVRRMEKNGWRADQGAD